MIRCNECRAKTGASPEFPRGESDVKHAATCSLHSATTDAAAVIVVTAEQKRIASEGGISHAGLTEDEIVDAVAAGKLSADAALNRDY